ncbi:hypothetical protein Stsp01_11000 [Streptomyces sp. NBRC 13847]|nr:hypothetical protein Stsp01_11000 [Streptomyces sp. NBRC 13847]
MRAEDVAMPAPVKYRSTATVYDEGGADRGATRARRLDGSLPLQVLGPQTTPSLSARQGSATVSAIERQPRPAARAWPMTKRRRRPSRECRGVGEVASVAVLVCAPHPHGYPGWVSSASVSPTPKKPPSVRTRSPVRYESWSIWGSMLVRTRAGPGLLPSEEAARHRLGLGSRRTLVATQARFARVG